MLLRVNNVQKSYNGQPVLRDVTFTIQAGESVGLIGTSGSGKSTLSRCILGLETIDSGTLHLGGSSWQTASRKETSSMKRRVQAVFQDSSDSFNPRWRLADSILEPLRHFRMIEPSEEPTKLAHLCEIVQLPYTCMSSYPRALSGAGRHRQVAQHQSSTRRVRRSDHRARHAHPTSYRRDATVLSSRPIHGVPIHLS